MLHGDREGAEFRYSRFPHVQQRKIIYLRVAICDQCGIALLRGRMLFRCCFRNYMTSERASEETGGGEGRGRGDAIDEQEEEEEEEEDISGRHLSRK